MESILSEQLMRAMFRFRKVGVTFPPRLDVHMGEMAILRWIAQNASECANASCLSNVEKSLYISKPAISQILNSLEKKGYISRETDKQDRRKIVLRLTPKGWETMQAAKAYLDEALGEMISRFGEKDTQTLIELFNRFADISDDVREINFANRGDESFD